jgi:phenylacetate-coenzyme A ligase PaaK-like adenylate-forming protein
VVIIFSVTLIHIIIVTKNEVEMFQIIQSRVDADNTITLNVVSEKKTLEEANTELRKHLLHYPEIYTYYVKKIQTRGRPKKEKTTVVRIPVSLLGAVNKLKQDYENQ